MHPSQKIKVMSEKETRASILELARFYGCEGDILQIFAKYDNLLRNCTNDVERQAISFQGNQEIHFFMSSRPGFISVGNKIIGK